MKVFVEKRKFRRISVEGIAEITWSGKVCAGTVSDLSLLGVMIDLPIPLDVGESINLTLRLGHGITIVVEGIVARTAVAGIGIRFTRIDLVSLARLKNIFEFNSLSIENMIEDYLMTVDRLGFQDSRRQGRDDV